MKTKLIENKSNDLVVFLTGWGCDDNQFKNFSSSKNLLLCWDYCTLDFEFDFSKYNKVSLLTYSAGVLIACLLQDKLPELEKEIKKLSKEGLFDESHKLHVPKIPKRIGVVTAPTGAAIKDILTTIKRRFPVCETILFPSLVQGMDAAKDIVKNIEIANTYDIDTLIVGRGGGSIEDLWAFNERIVAQAVFDCTVPIISAVGHETDFTICDFVADMRAPTPSAAAELAVPSADELMERFNDTELRIKSAVRKNLERKKLLLRMYSENCGFLTIRFLDMKSLI